MGKELPEVDEVTTRHSGDAVGFFVQGVSASMRPVEAVIRELSQSNVPVLLVAEKGAGKHATARRIHEVSPRAAQPFLSVSCSTVKPEDLDFSNAGCVLGEGRGGTIFFVEVAELSDESQACLTEALVQGTGSAASAPRFIFGSSQDLDVEVKKGRLREDFYYRISGVCLRLPPLRQRKEDIPLLMENFLKKYAGEFHRPVPELSSEMYRLFREYSWPGNLRELENAARLLVAVGDEQLAMGGLRTLLQRPSGNGNGVSLKAASRAASHEAEKALILKVLTRTRWNRRRAAEELQISYKALLYKLKQIGYEGFGA